MNIDINEIIETKIEEIGEEFGKKAKTKVLEIILFKDMQNKKQDEQDNYIPIAKFNNEFNYPKVTTLRKYVYEGRDDFRDCWKKINGNLFIIRSEFLKWRECC